MRLNPVVAAALPLLLAFVALAPGGVTAPVAAQSTGQTAESAQRFSGALTIDGQAAPTETTVTALVNDKPCGEAKTTEAGRYSVEVRSASAEQGCGEAGATVRFKVTPKFGDGWFDRGSGGTFEAGATPTYDIAIDLLKLTPNGFNVPVRNSKWFDPYKVRVGICDQLSPEMMTATQQALAMWEQARLTQGLRIELVREEATACVGSQRGIAIFEGSLPDGVLGAQAYFDLMGRPCPIESPITCIIQKAVVVLNGGAIARDNPQERAVTVAHEIGHALGLQHATKCDGGTIMWATTRCAFPLTHIGVDDVAALNNALPAVPAPPTSSLLPAEGASLAP